MRDTDAPHQGGRNQRQPMHPIKHFRFPGTAGDSRLLPLIVAIAVVAGSTGCISLAPSEKLPETVAAMPESYDSTMVTGDYAPLEWWTAFDDRGLERVVDSALTANLDLVAAIARIEEVRGQFRAARGSRFPSVTATGGANTQDSPANTGAFSRFLRDSSGTPTITRFKTTTYSLSVGFAYELDFWGRVRNDTRAALRQALATEADFETARMGVIAETISTWFEIADLRTRITLAVETIDVLSERVDIAQDRYDRGLTSSFELYQIRQDFRNTQAGLPDLEAQLTSAEGRLAVLLGRYPGELEGLLPDHLSLDPAFGAVPSGLPADILVQRPDIRAAALRLESSRLRVGARRAELFPAISISASLGTQSSNTADLINTVDQWARNLAANITAPIFQGGRIRANIAVAEAQYQQAAAAYTKSVLTAYQEVVAALDANQEQFQRYTFLRSQLDEALSAANLQADRYRSGIGGYTDYLDATRNLFLVRTALSAAGRQYALARLAVHRALGGAWTDDGLAPRFEMVRSEVPIATAD